MNEEERLKKIVSDLQAGIKQAGRVNSRTGTRPADYVNIFPEALGNDKPENIGIIFDKKLNIKDLVSANLVNPPEKLKWLQMDSLEKLTKFLENRGIPAYISFGSHDGAPDAVNTLIKACRKLKLKDLPAWNVHNPVLTKKMSLEASLIGY